MELDGLDKIFDGNVTNPFEGKEEPYIGPENMLDVDNYVNNATYFEA